ncbi:hypothetical protein ACHAWU_002990 [Discostella pseudostelligera]|uniref:Uncharacterized protein n=1 Tax=Discostella pseudostelligera TaxID=259834 RepID=A0ABD3M390_9STRA
MCVIIELLESIRSMPRGLPQSIPYSTTEARPPYYYPFSFLVLRSAPLPSGVEKSIWSSSIENITTRHDVTIPKALDIHLIVEGIGTTKTIAHSELPPETSARHSHVNHPE